jgi:hypothetical protein
MIEKCLDSLDIIHLVKDPLFWFIALSSCLTQVSNDSKEKFVRFFQIAQSFTWLTSMSANIANPKKSTFFTQVNSNLNFDKYTDIFYMMHYANQKMIEVIEMIYWLKLAWHFDIRTASFYKVCTSWLMLANLEKLIQKKSLL